MQGVRHALHFFGLSVTLERRVIEVPSANEEGTSRAAHRAWAGVPKAACGQGLVGRKCFEASRIDRVALSAHEASSHAEWPRSNELRSDAAHRTRAHRLLFTPLVTLGCLLGVRRSRAN